MNTHHVTQSPWPSVCRVTVTLCMLIVGVLGTSHAAGSQALRTYTSLVLKDGRRLGKTEVVNYTPNGILVRHAGGATVLSTAILPDAVLADLHLTLRPAASSIESDPAFLALAHKPAVASEDIASKPAVFAPQDRPATAPEITANIAADLANAPALNAATLPETPATLTPAGEGNLPEFFSGQSQIADAAASTHSNIVGRVVVNLPNGETRFLADVEVRAYPADVLAGYLRSAQTRSRNAAQQIMAQAELATKEGRLADAESLKTQAAEAAGRTIEYIPAAPYIARTDAHGYFTVRHDLRDVRLLAVGYVTVATGKMRYEWVGLQPEREIILTEANATTVAPPTRLPRFASR